MKDAAEYKREVSTNKHTKKEIREEREEESRVGNHGEIEHKRERKNMSVILSFIHPLVRILDFYTWFVLVYIDAFCLR